jgi:hypothetical protein
LKQHKPWFDEECSELLDERKKAKLHCFQNPNETNGDNLNSVRHETSRTFGNKKLEYLTENELEMNSKNKNIRNLYRAINKFKDCQPRSKLIKDENDDLAYSHNILNAAIECTWH